ncbi:MAG: carbohydrate ABC transporter permease [Anaerolineae bacterium]|jgi:ABC-type glycerol-3-phosphate transport system permease component|nr:carbohydrate ABC transporter permease [Anaerolineae bacterium]
MKTRPAVLIASYVIVTTATILFLFPIVWLFLTSLKPPAEVLEVALPSRLTLENYETVLATFPVGQYFINSILIAVGSTLVSVGTGSLAAYSLSQYRFRTRQPMLLMTLLMRLLPGVALGIPLFYLFSSVRLTNTMPGLILAHTAIQLPLVIWIMIGFFEDTPAELVQAGLVDGCTRFSVIYRIILPIVTPGLAVAAIFSYLLSWNNLDLSLILAPTPRLVTMPVGISNMNLVYGVRWDLMAAAAVMYIIPTIILALLLQRYIVQGLTLGAVKG